MAKEKQRTIVLEDGKTIVLNLPNVGQGSDADLKYAQGYTKALKDGLLPKVAIERMLIESGAWGPDKDQETQRLNDELEVVVLASREEEDPIKKADYKEQFDVIRQKMTALALERETLAAASAEARGEEARYGFLTWTCVTNEDGSKIWDSSEAFYAETDSVLVRTCLQELVAFMSGLAEKIQELDRILEGDVEETEDVVEETPKETPDTPTEEIEVKKAEPKKKAEKKKELASKE